MNKKEKVIFIDYMVFVFRAIFAWRKNKQIPAPYTVLNMIISNLSKIGVDKNDTVIFAIDGRNSWRKDVETSYKGNRKAQRESFEDVNWSEMFQQMSELIEKLKQCTDFRFLKIDRIEADDIMAEGVRRYVDKEVVLCTIDSDMEQLMVYDNCKIFSPMKKYKSKNGAYKIKPKNFNVYQFITKKINKEKSDNLINPVLSVEDYDKRLQAVSLLELPDFVTVQIKEGFDNLEKGKEDLDYFPYSSLLDRYIKLETDKSNVITYEQCENYKPRKKKKKGGVK